MKWMAQEMEKQYECKVQALGPGLEDEKEIKVLNRIISWNKLGTEDIVTYEADPRHAEITGQELGLQDAKSLLIPITKVEADDESDILDLESTARCKSVVARAKHMAADRPDIQYACKELSMAMAKPTKSDHERLKRLEVSASSSEIGSQMQKTKEQHDDIVTH